MRSNYVDFVVNKRHLASQDIPSITAQNNATFKAKKLQKFCLKDGIRSEHLIPASAKNG